MCLGKEIEITWGCFGLFFFPSPRTPCLFLRDEQQAFQHSQHLIKKIEVVILVEDQKQMCDLQQRWLKKIFS